MYDMKLEKTPRQITKEMMKDDRRRRFGSVQCDFCHRAPGVDMHEIISRARTVKNPEMREKSYQKELCSLLCLNCHHNEPIQSVMGQQRLWLRLYDLYTKARVVEALERIPEQFRQGIILP